MSELNINLFHIESLFNLPSEESVKYHPSNTIAANIPPTRFLKRELTNRWSRMVV